MARGKEPRIQDAISDQLLAGSDARTAFDQGGLLKELKKVFTVRPLHTKVDHHSAGAAQEGNSRNTQCSLSASTADR